MDTVHHSKLLYHARAINPYIIPAINDISTQQAQPTIDTNKKATILMDYAHIYPNEIIRYRASNIQHHTDSYATYLVIQRARSCGEGHFYLSSIAFTYTTIPSPPHNGPILTECVRLRNVMISAAEMETGTLHHNVISAIPIRTTL